MSIIMLSISLDHLREQTIRGNEAFKAFTETVIATCPNRRVAHLAKHAKRHRAREKNRKRAIRWAWTTWGEGEENDSQ